MARTQILPTDPGAVKVWSSKVAVDTKKKMYFDKMTGGEEDALPVVTKTELESGPGDEVTTYLIAKIRGKPVEGEQKLEGKEKKLSHATHKMRIDKHRQAVNVGDVMNQKRVPYKIATQARNRLSDYMAEIYDEQITMTASGGRGTGDEIQHYEIGYAGFPNAFTAPDANHLMTWDGSRAGKANLTANDKLGTNVIDKLVLRAKKQMGSYDDSSKPFRMEAVQIEGGKHFIFLTAPEGMYDIRREVGDAGWLTLEKAKATQEGAKSPIFTGGKAYYNGVVLDETQTIVKFNDYGAGSNIPAVRSLFLGAHGVAVSHGIKSQATKTRFELSESSLDHDEEEVIIVRMIAGFSKTRFNGQDFGVIVNDSAFTAAQ